MIREARQVVTETEEYITLALNQTLAYEDNTASEDSWSLLSSVVEAYDFDEVQEVGRRARRSVAHAESCTPAADNFLGVQSVRRQDNSICQRLEEQRDAECAKRRARHGRSGLR